MLGLVIYLPLLREKACLKGKALSIAFGSISKFSAFALALFEILQQNFGLFQIFEI
jgi:hypothetical protein